jgi:hypothetical protein
LLDVHRRLGFSGLPYIRHPDQDAQLPFTDAVCYTAGALIRLLSSPDAHVEQRDECTRVLKEAIAWLLNAGQRARGRHGEELVGWSWTSPEAARSTEFEGKTPAQTYFTTQVLTTLCEALFDCFPVFESEARGILGAIVGAKRFLLGSMLDARHGEVEVSGWCDFHTRLARDMGQTAMESYAKHERDQNEEEPRADITLYGLESLSYLRYYAREGEYRETRARLLEAAGVDSASLGAYTDEEASRLDRAFAFCLELAKNREQFFDFPCEIQVPEPLNLGPGEKGLLESRGRGRKSVYRDGTVAYNVLNALNYHALYMDVKVDNQTLLTTWRDEELALVGDILERGFSGRAFTHATTFQRPEVIYATRTAVSSFLSWGVSPPAAAVDGRVRALVEELSKAVGCGVPLPRQDSAAVAEWLGPEESEALLRFGFIIGVYVAMLRTGRKDTRMLAEHLDLQQTGDLDFGAFLRTNGMYLLRRVARMLAASTTEAAEEIDKATSSTLLVKQLKRSLEKSRAEMLTPSSKGRVASLKTLSEDLIAQSSVAERAIMEDLGATL